MRSSGARDEKLMVGFGGATEREGWVDMVAMDLGYVLLNLQKKAVVELDCREKKKKSCLVGSDCLRLG